MPPSFDRPIKRILVMKWSAMGDVVIASAGIEDICNAFPDAEVDLNTCPPWDRLYTNDPRIGRLLSINVRGPSQLIGIIRWLAQVRARHYDLVVDFQTTDRSRLLLALLWLVGGQIRYRVGNKAAFPYNLRRKMTTGLHAMKVMSETLRAIGVTPRATRPILHCHVKHRRKVDDLMGCHGLMPGRFVMFLPGSQAAGYLKRWGASRFAELGQKLHKEGIEKIAIVGGQDEYEVCQEISQLGADWAVNLCGQTELLDIVALSEQVKFIVGNDTGTSHISATSAKPMLIICGPTDPQRVLPAGSNVDYLQADLPCINCYLKHCSHHSCMELITPQMVYEKLAAMHALDYAIDD